MTEPERDLLTSVQTVASHLPELPWMAVLDAVEESVRLEQDAPWLDVLREAIAVARLRTGRGLLAA